MKRLSILLLAFLVPGCAAYVQPGVVAVTPAPTVYTTPAVYPTTVVYPAPVVYPVVAPVYRPAYGWPYNYGRPWYGRRYYY